ncbi:hypothetical protein LCGC14_2242610, partial [marine sediment metagenome]
LYPLRKIHKATKIRLLKIRYKQAEHLQKMIRSVSLLEGKKGRGKTIAAVSICYNLKEFFDIPTVCIGSSMDLVKSEYGNYQFLDDKEFINELSKLTSVGKSTEDSEIGGAIEETLKTMGVTVTNACLVFDEAYKFFDARTPSDKLVRVFGYFVAQSRHYKCTILLLSPYRDMIDKRVRRQIDYYGRCFTNQKTHYTTVRMSGGMESWRFKIFGPNYWEMYDTHVLLGFRAKHLQIGL